MESLKAGEKRRRRQVLLSYTDCPFICRYGGDIEMDIDAVEERAGDFVSVALHLEYGAAAVVSSRALDLRRSRRDMGSLPFCHLSFSTKIPKAGYPGEVKTWGDAIRKRRMDLRMRQVDAAEEIGCTSASVNNWEMGHSEPRVAHYQKIVEFLGCTTFDAGPSLADRLLHYRKIRSISQKDFARIIGVDPTTLARWEQGEREPKGLFLKAVIRACEETARRQVAKASLFRQAAMERHSS